MIVGTLRIAAMIPGCQSLKDKRRVLKGLKDRIHNKFNVAVAETDHHDLWQRMEIGIATIGSDTSFVHGVLDTVLSFIRQERQVEVLDAEREVL